MKEFTNNYFMALSESKETRYGYWYAFRAWRNSVEKKADFFTLDDFNLNNEETHDIIECLKEAGVTEFAITNTSTALMNMLHGFVLEDMHRSHNREKLDRRRKRIYT